MQDKNVASPTFLGGHMDINSIDSYTHKPVKLCFIYV